MPLGRDAEITWVVVSMTLSLESKIVVCPISTVPCVIELCFQSPDWELVWWLMVITLSEEKGLLVILEGVPLLFQHIFISCPLYVPSREELVEFFLANNIEFSLQNLLSILILSQIILNFLKKTDVYSFIWYVYIIFM